MPALSRLTLCGWLGGVGTLLVLLNVGIFYNAYYSRISGGFFAQGKIILSTGDEVNVASRINFSKQGILEFQKSGVWSRSAFRQIIGRMGGDFIFRTVSAKSSPIGKLTPEIEDDDDLSFNQVYYLKEGGQFTYLRIYSGDEGHCFYIEELSRVRCLGVGG